MNFKLWFLVALAAVTVNPAEKKIKRSALPAPVEKALAEVSQGASIVGFSKETENGRTLYEVELKSGNLTKDVSLDETGKVIIVEQEMTLDSLPPAVKAGIVKAAGKATIAKVESITEGTKVTYEAALKGFRTKELLVDTGGKLLSNK